MKRYDVDKTIRCPICRKRFSDESWCEHLVFSADDSVVRQNSVKFADAESLWRTLKNESKEDYTGDPTAFVRTFVEPCEAAARVDEQVWDGGFPGLSGIWMFVWSADPNRLKEEIRGRLLDELMKIRSQAVSEDKGGSVGHGASL